MTIIFFVSEYDRFNGGQRSLLQLLQTLKKTDLKPLVIFPSKGKCEAAYKAADVDTLVLPCSHELKKFGAGLMQSSLLYYLRLFIFHILPYSFKIYKIMRHEEARILHVNTTRSLLISSVVPKFFGKKLVWHVRGVLGSIKRSFLSISELLSDKIIIVAENLRYEISEKHRHKCVRVYNSISNESFRHGQTKVNVISKSNTGSNQLIFATMAAVTPFKGYHHLIDAIHLVNKEVGEETVKFISVGQLFDELYVKYLQDKIANYGMSNFVFEGWCDNPVDYYHAADVVLLPTIMSETFTYGGKAKKIVTGEGLPRTILEAMFLGKPVIATDVAGTPEQITHGKNGYLVEPGNANDLANAIIETVRLSENERKSMGDEGKKLAMTIFSDSNTLKGFLSIVNTI